MKHKIVKEELNKSDKSNLKIDLDIHIQTISEIDKDTAIALIGGVINGKYEKYFNEPINGKFNITYPLKVIVEKELKNINSIGELLWEISQTYKKIYDEENKSTTISPGYIPGMMNRNKTNGKYGIWGHDLGDLVFEGIEIYDNGTIDFFVGS